MKTKDELLQVKIIIISDEIYVAMNNPFQQSFKQTYSAIAPTFQSIRYNSIYNRSVALAISWKFGGGRREKENGNGIEEHINKSSVLRLKP
ncbi:hypothetical protein [Pedobacter cryoconitis]|uniref:hypothetical protein n=1 Tax=Pedobacter cryoconitis TaxID=188932 RepID=UPI000837E82D|nr:hypothetical protein [Pedobacter cryoconitis]